MDKACSARDECVVEDEEVEVVKGLGIRELLVSRKRDERRYVEEEGGS